MSLTITEPLQRLPGFSELKALAQQHHLQFNGDDSTGDFCHPDAEHPKVTGHYTVESQGDIHGDFTAHGMGKVAGTFAITEGKAEVTITEKPFLIPDALLKSSLSAALKEFCARFSNSSLNS